MIKLASQRIGKSVDRVLAGAVCRLKGDLFIGQRRPDLDNRSAVPRKHAPQRRQGAVDKAEIKHIRHSLVVGSFHLLDRRENTLTIASFTQISISPSFCSIWLAARSTASASETSVGMKIDSPPKSCHIPVWLPRALPDCGPAIRALRLAWRSHAQSRDQGRLKRL